MSVPPNSPLRR